MNKFRKVMFWFEVVSTVTGVVAGIGQVGMQMKYVKDSIKAKKASDAANKTSADVPPQDIPNNPNME